VGCVRRDSNPQPSDPKSDALSIELRTPATQVINPTFVAPTAVNPVGATKFSQTYSVRQLPQMPWTSKRWCDSAKPSEANSDCSSFVINRSSCGLGSKSLTTPHSVHTR